MMFKLKKDSISLFIQLLVSFIVVIFVMTLFYTISYTYYLNKYKQQMVSKIERQFTDICDKIELEISDIYKKFMGVVMDNTCFSILTGEHINGYDLYFIVKRLRLFEYGKHVKPYCFIISDNSKFVMGSDATYHKDLFFDNVLYNLKYDLSFWENQIKEPYNLAFFPGDFFNTKSQNSKTHYVPVICKYYKKPFLMVALIDFNTLVNSFENNYTSGFFILDKSATLIFTDQKISNMPELPVLKLDNLYDNELISINNGYVLYYKSSICDLIYCKYFEKGEIGSSLNHLNSIFIVALSIAFSICMLLAIYIVKSLNISLKHVCNLLADYDNTPTLPYNMYRLKNSVENLIKSNISYTSEMGTLNSMISEMLYQTKIRNLPILYDGKIQGFELGTDYYMVLIRLHRKDSDMNSDMIDNAENNQEIIARLKNAFDDNVSRSFKSYITFQAENNELVSIVNYDDEERNVYMLLNSILKSISDDFFFTAVISKKQHGSSQLGQIYANLSSTIFNRQLISKSQILYEDAIDRCYKYAKFTSDQQTKLINLLYTGNSDTIVNCIFDILEYNAKRNINNLCFNILFIEIASIVLKYVEQYYKVNDIVNINLFYNSISQCATLSQYKVEIRKFIDEILCSISDKTNHNYDMAEFVKSYIETNYSKDIYLELVANELNISKSYLSYYFKNVTGVGFVEYVNQYRIDRSKEQLSISDATVNEIAINCGFNNVTSFIRTFKKYTGMTPKEYQRNKVYNQGNKI